MASRVTQKGSLKGLSKSISKLERQRRSRLSIGFFQPEIASRAAFNEFGTETIPERPFMRTSFDEHQADYERRMDRAMDRLEAGQIAPEIALVSTANQVRNDLIETIQTWSEPGNAPSTIRAKGADNPLVDTGEMQRSIQISDTSQDGGQEAD